MGTDGAVATLQKAAQVSGESLWHMPLPKELRKLLDSDTADLINSKLGNPTGSMMVGGLFLKEFVGLRNKNTDALIEWAHLDVAGPAHNEDSAFGYTPKGGTGVMLRTLVEVAESL
jgi:leucyl aminopeptidase